MAEKIKLNRIERFHGGITNSDRDRREGVCLNMEELDIFSNPSSIEPATILASDTSITTGTPRRVWAFTVDDADNLYALSDDAGGTPKADIWRLTSASADNPGNFSLYLDGAQNSRNTYASNLIWHGIGDPVSTAFLYYVVGTNSLYRYGDIKGTPSEASVGTLTGLTATSKYVPMIRREGELLIGHGQFIARVDDGATFTAAAFTLPNEWEVVDLKTIGDEVAILARNIKTGENNSRIFFWDGTATTGVNDEIIIPMGGPEALVNHNETLRVFCARNSILRIYEVQGKLPIKTHEVSCNTTHGVGNSDYTVYPQSVYIKDNVVHFGLARTLADNDSGIYALGKVTDDRSLALVLLKRYSATNAASAKSHTPLAAISVGPNVYSVYIDNTSTAAYTVMRTEENNSPTRSSNALYESIWIDAGSPEVNKEWTGFYVVTKPIAASTSLVVDARVDNATSYDTNSDFTLDNSNDQTMDGTTADTFWFREWTSVIGRTIQVRIAFTSSGTSKISLYSISLLSRETNLL